MNANIPQLPIAPHLVKFVALGEARQRHRNGTTAGVVGPSGRRKRVPVRNIDASLPRPEAVVPRRPVLPNKAGRRECHDLNPLAIGRRQPGSP
eukprot:COSAG05_NODE_11582_length_506_cov_1.012285_2_plen_92_part_01